MDWPSEMFVTGAGVGALCAEIGSASKGSKRREDAILLPPLFAAANKGGAFRVKRENKILRIAGL